MKASVAIRHRVKAIIPLRNLLAGNKKEPRLGVFLQDDLRQGRIWSSGPRGRGSNRVSHPARLEARE